MKQLKFGVEPDIAGNIYSKIATVEKRSGRTRHRR